MTARQTERRLRKINDLSKAWKHSFDVALQREDPLMAADALTELLKLAHEMERLTGCTVPAIEGTTQTIRALRESGVH